MTSLSILKWVRAVVGRGKEGVLGALNHFTMVKSHRLPLRRDDYRAWICEFTSDCWIKKQDYCEYNCVLVFGCFSGDPPRDLCSASRRNLG